MFGKPDMLISFVSTQTLYFRGFISHIGRFLKRVLSIYGIYDIVRYSGFAMI